MGKTAWNKKYPDFWICKQCGISFSNKTGHKRVFCSHPCRHAFMKGRNNPGCFRPGPEHWNYSGNPMSRDKTRFTYQMIKQIAKKAKYQCEMCGVVFKQIPIYKQRHLMSFDHIVPIKLGGEHTIKNGQLLCRVCNKKKTRADLIKILKTSRC